MRIFAWMPLAGLAVMALLTYLLLELVVNCGDVFWLDVSTGCAPHDPTVTPMPREPAVIFAELRGRLTWAISVLFFALTAAVAFAMALRSVMIRLRPAVRLTEASLFAVFVGLLTAVYLGLGQTYSFNSDLLEEIYSVTHSEVFVVTVQMLGAVALVALAIAVSLILARPGSVKAEVAGATVPARAAVLAHDQHSVRILLYVGAIALIAGTLQVTSLYAWAVTMLPVEWLEEYISYGRDEIDIPNAMGLLTGSYYSLLLAVIFIPAFLRLRGRVRRLVDEAAPNATADDRADWIDENGLYRSLPRKLVSVFAVVAPMLAGGPMTDLLEWVVSGW